MGVDQHGTLEIFATSTVNPQSFYLPMTVNELSNSQTAINGRLLIAKGDAELLGITSESDPDTIEYYLVDATTSPDPEDILLYICTNGGFPQNPDCARNQTQLTNIGHMFSNKDWRNFEFTVFFEAMAIQNNDASVFLAGRSGWESPSNSGN